MYEERQWLAWLVKARIIVVTLLLGVELLVARLMPTTLPLRFFINIILLWYAISIFHLLLPSFWDEFRIQSLLQVLTDLVLVTLVVALPWMISLMITFTQNIFASIPAYIK